MAMAGASCRGLAASEAWAKASHHRRSRANPPAADAPEGSRRGPQSSADQSESGRPADDRPVGAAPNKARPRSTTTGVVRAKWRRPTRIVAARAGDGTAPVVVGGRPTLACARPGPPLRLRRCHLGRLAVARRWQRRGQLVVRLGHRGKDSGPAGGIRLAGRPAGLPRRKMAPRTGVGQIPLRAAYCRNPGFVGVVSRVRSDRYARNRPTQRVRIIDPARPTTIRRLSAEFGGNGQARNPKTQKSWRRPMFPKGCPLSIFGAGELNFRVRDGNGCGLSARVTRISCVRSMSFGG